MRIRLAVPERHVHPAVINAALEAVTRLDEHMIRSGEVPPWSPATGVRWRPENMGDEHFDHAQEVIRRGWGDCDDLAPWKAATLRASGEDPGATAVAVPSGPSMYHAIVNRSDGSIDDPSVEAGMRATRQGVVGGEDGASIQIWALDPHDGRVYTGFLAPTVGPLAAHTGPAVAVRPAGVSGLWEGRCDVPLQGSPLVRVHAYKRHRPHSKARQHKVAGDVPYALSCTHYAGNPATALSGAIVGAVLCGDAAESAIPLDRYKLLAIQGLCAGMPAEHVTHALAQRIHHEAMTQGTSVVGGDPGSMAHGIVCGVQGAIAHLPC